MEVLLSRASEVVSLLAKPGADPHHSEAKQTAQDLRSTYFALASQVQANPARLGFSEKKQVWELSCKIWNYCVDIGNSCTQPEPWHAQLRNVASDFASLLPSELESDEEVACKLNFFHATGQLYAELAEMEAAEACFSKATEYGSKLLGMLKGSAEGAQLASEYIEGIVELHIDRARTAWALQQQALAQSLLAKAQALLANDNLLAHRSVSLAMKLAQNKLDRATHLLDQSEEAVKQNAHEAAGLLEGAYEDVTNLEVDEDDPAFEESSTVATRLSTQVLTCLALAYVLEGDHGMPAMGCIAKLREASSKGSAEDHQISFLALQALLQLGKNAEAETELLSIASSDNAPLELCTSALAAMLEAPGLCGTVASAAALILNRHPGLAQLPVQLVELILNRADSKESCKEYEGIALKLLQDESVMSAILKEGDPEVGEQRRRLHGLLWNQAAKAFQTRSYGDAVLFFTADLQFAPQPDKAKVARSLAMCSLGLRQLDRALDYVGIANAEEGSNIYTSFIAFKVHLERKDSAAACEELCSMLKSADFSVDFLTVSAHEAISSSQPEVAREALQQLHSLLVKSQEPPTPGQEALVLRNLIKVTADAAGAKQEGEPVYAQLTQQFRTAAARMQEVSLHSFAGDTDGRPVQLEWFAGSAWNYALEAAKLLDYASAAALFAASADFHRSHPVQDSSCLNYQKMACLMAATAALSTGPEEAADKNSLEAAGKMLARCREAIDMADKMRQGPGSTATDKALIFCLLQEFDLAVRQKDRQRQMAVLADCQKLADFSAENYLKMVSLAKAAAAAAGGGYEAVEKACLSSALRQLTQQSPLSAFSTIAQTLRRIICLSNNDAEKLALYSDARSLLADIPAGSYPAREVAWLITTCFNRGCLHAKFCRYDTAQSFMRAAIDLLPHCPELGGKREQMEGELERLQKLAGQKG